MTWYKTGTVSVTNGSPNVTLTSGNAQLNIFPDDGFVGPDGRTYAILSVSNATQFVLSENYRGATISGQNYVIIPTADHVQLRDMLVGVNTLIDEYETVKLEAGAGRFASGTAASPGVRGVDHAATGLVWNSDGTLSISVNGVIATTFDAGGIDGFVTREDLEQSDGGSLVGFSQGGSGSVDRTVEGKLRDLVSVKDFGAVGDGITDDTAAFQNAINFCRSVFVPEGTYRLTAPISIIDKDFMLSGAGRDVANLIWEGVDVDGIRVRTPSSTYNSKSRPAVTISNLSILSNTAGAGKAIDAVMTITDTPNVYGDATTVTLENVDIRGDDHYSSNSKYWKYGIYMVDTGGVSILHCRLFSVSTVSNVYGIYIKDDTASNMRFNITGGGIWSYDYGIVLEAKAPKTIEGIYITGYEIVGGLFGIRCIGGPIHALEFTNGHIDSREAPISFAAGTGSSALVVSGSYIQRGDKGGDWTPSSGYIFDINGVAEARIFGNNFLGDSRVSHYGVVVRNSDNCLVFGNTFRNTLGASVLVNAGGESGTGTKVFGNTSVGNYPMVVNGDNYSDMAGPNFSNSQNGTKEIFGVADVTLEATGAGWLMLPNGGFRNNLLSAVVSNASPLSQSGAVGCDLSLSEETMLLIAVTPNPGVGTYRVNYSAKGR